MTAGQFRNLRMLRRPSILGAALLALAVAPVAAQRPATAGPEKATSADKAQRSDRPRVSLEEHDERTSREMFSACDADDDDRLDLFEANDAFESLGDPKDVRSFARLDTDRDGYVSWPEFDTHYRFLTEHGKALQLRPCRPLPQTEQAATPETAAATPLQRFLRLYDGNRNGGLDPDEVDRVATQLGLLPIRAAMLRNLDADRSGKIDEAELAPVFPQLEKLMPASATGDASAESPLLQPWGLGDADADGNLTLEEFTAVLRRVDAGLVKWARHLFARLDKDRNGKLDARELGTDRRPVRTALLR